MSFRFALPVLVAVLLIVHVRESRAQSPQQPQAQSQSQAKPQAEPPTHHTASSVIAESNNPLADLIGFNFNEYFAPSLYNVDGVANVFNMQAVIIPVKRHDDLHHLIRVTMPVNLVPATPTTYVSGFGDLVFQDAFKFSKAAARNEWGVGPVLVIPTATSDLLGTGKWQAGVAAIYVRLLEGGSIVGGLVTWQTDFAGDSARPGTNLSTLQPQIALALGTSGFYLSSSPIWSFNFETDQYLIPFSFGFGKVMEIGKTIVNVTWEPQITIYQKGEQQPAIQFFVGLTLQWRRHPATTTPRPVLAPRPWR